MNNSLKNIWLPKWTYNGDNVNLPTMNGRISMWFLFEQFWDEKTGGGPIGAPAVDDADTVLTTNNIVVGATTLPPGTTVQAALVAIAGQAAGVDGNTTNIVRIDNIANVAPTALEVPTPSNGDVAIVFLNNGTTEYWSHNGTNWNLSHSVTPLATALRTTVNFTTTDWVIVAPNATYDIPQTLHTRGINPIVKVQETITGLFYDLQTEVITAANGDVTLRIADTAIFNGRVILI